MIKLKPTVRGGILNLVVESTYGTSVEITLKDGSVRYIPLTKDSSVSIGEEVNLAKVNLLTLCKPGEKDIYRIAAYGEGDTDIESPF